ncbi:hypothetical protein [Ruminococcus flavefaciens]|uniref:hypothetical protein n=1 Tax=Ruminococcus flavefaciens TaxID=1265 RepID=UPI00046379A0|nr:hypothetical protein [Ruminococcus flavefaciens]
MFGRRKEEDYDEYNEKYAAKYDDDYIAPSKEYRQECGHSHEQSYSNINTVEECHHSHEQTYNDADIEQHSYDSYASLESRFQPFLVSNEHLLWVGGYDKKSPKPVQQRKKDRKARTILILISIALIVLGCITNALCALSFIGFIMLIITLVSAAGGFNQGIYAITDMRVINVRNNRPVFAPLVEISNINAVTGSNNTGYVTYNTRRPVRVGQQAQNGGYRSVISNINDPQRVKRILQDAVHGAMVNKQRFS